MFFRHHKADTNDKIMDYIDLQLQSRIIFYKLFFRYN